MVRRLVATAGIGLAVALAAAAAASSFPRFGSGCARADFRSGGVTVRAERCGPASGSHAVIVLHGCGGFDTFDHRLTTTLPGYGISTLDVDYFGPTPPPGTKGFCNAFPRGTDTFATWVQVAVDAATSLHARFKHVGAVGWSLGAGVVIAAAEDRRPFAALAAFSAFGFGQALDRASLLPPSIFLDGGTRDIVPPSNARALYAAAKGAHVPTALYIYGNGTHGWPGAQGTAGISRAAAFLARHLGK